MVATEIDLGTVGRARQLKVIVNGRRLHQSMIFDTLMIVDRKDGWMTQIAEPVASCAPLAAPLLSDEQAKATAKVFKALADPARVRILNMLATSGGAPVCVCHLIEPLGLSQPTVSHHLKKLTDAGLLEREQRGKWAYYSMKSEAAETLAAVVDLKGVCC